MRDGNPVGLLGIDLDTRRRNRLNGKLMRDRSGFNLRVEQSFGNCPKYIQRRGVRFMADPSLPSDVMPILSNGLNEEALRMISRADTFFVASYADLPGSGRQVDVSHRGGPSGFVAIDGDWLVIPDYAGNMQFNTLGNILINPRAGLAFVDFDTGDLLQMTGEAEVMGAPTDDIPGAERLWRFRPLRTVLRQGAVPLRWEFREWSPFLPGADRPQRRTSRPETMITAAPTTVYTSTVAPKTR
jgi:predicted pyridoxine 5'-phosphate oxidase superfamily flavin-nucleotide-binding protein